jgi:nitroreductase/NAD-dependent dihydropyrimidine dehydrogenase PreA subunit
MGLLIIDQTKCKKDGFCVRECPAAIIRLPEGDHYPEIAKESEDACIDCGHCMAVCPHGALDHRRITLKSSPPILEEFQITEKQAVQFLRSRRSIRVYQDRPVEKDKIRKLIEVARYAPTGGNSQMIEWTVIADKLRIKKMAGLSIDWLREVVKDPRAIEGRPYLPRILEAWDAGYDSVLRNAPVVVVASAPREAMNGLIDLTIALSYLDLMAPAMGLGACWAGLLQGAFLGAPSIKAAGGMPDDHPHHYPMMVGYPGAKYFRLPERRAPKIVFA